MKNLQLVSIIFAMLLTAACKNEPKKPLTMEQAMDKFASSPGLNKSERNFVVHKPKGWSSLDTMIRGVKFHLIIPPSEVVATSGANVNILNESLQGISFEKYMEHTKQTMRDYMPEFKELDAGTFNTVDKIKGAWFYYTGKQNGIQLACIAYIIPADDIAYIITAGTRKGYLSQYRSTFDTIAQSFEFKD